MKAAGNILWHIPFMGFITAGITYLMGIVLIATVIAAPLGLGLIEHAKFLLKPFGRAMVSSDQMTKNKVTKTETSKYWGVYSKIIMILWLPFGALFALGAAFQTIGLFFSIIGIPAGLVMAKSLSTYFNPVGKVCVSQAVADEIERRMAQEEINEKLAA